MASNAKKASLWVDCHTDVGNNTQKSFYCTTSDEETNKIVNNEQIRIASFYASLGFNPVGAGSSWVSPADYPKNVMAYNLYGIRTIMIEKYEGDMTLGGTGMNCEETDINNYVCMLRSYILATLKSDSDVLGTSCWKNAVTGRDFD